MIGSERLIPHVFFFMVLLSYESHHTKSIITMSKVIQLYAGLNASGQHPLTHGSFVFCWFFFRWWMLLSSLKFKRQVFLFYFKNWTTQIYFPKFSSIFIREKIHLRRYNIKQNVYSTKAKQFNQFTNKSKFKIDSKCLLCCSYTSVGADSVRFVRPQSF